MQETVEAVSSAPAPEGDSSEQEEQGKSVSTVAAQEPVTHPASSERASPKPEPVMQGECHQAWLKATVKVSLTIFPDDGNDEGRKLLVIVHEEGGTPLTEFIRDPDGADPGIQTIRNLLSKLRQELPSRLAAKAAAPAPEAKPTQSSTKKKAARAPKTAVKKPASKSSKKQSTKQPAGAK
jgi:hypothetical protein